MRRSLSSPRQAAMSSARSGAATAAIRARPTSNPALRFITVLPSTFAKLHALKETNAKETQNGQSRQPRGAPSDVEHKNDGRARGPQTAAAASPSPYPTTAPRIWQALRPSGAHADLHQGPRSI